MENIERNQLREIIVNGYATPDITQKQLVEWSDDLTYVSCYSYGFTIEGDLVSVNDEEFIQNAYHNGIAPLMVISAFNEFKVYHYDLLDSIFTNPNRRDRLINNIILTVLEKNYYGAVINFGYIAPEDKEQFVVTVSKTAERLNRNSALCIVSITPGNSDDGIDYKSLSRAANFLELKAFQTEQIYQLPKTIVPVNHIREILLSKIPLIGPNKILLGLPNYGYDWVLPFFQGQSIAEQITNGEALKKAKKIGVEIQYDEQVQSPYYRYMDELRREHVVWFDNTRSIKVKLDMVNEFGLAGISIWTIMSPFPVELAAMNNMFNIYKV